MRSTHRHVVTERRCRELTFCAPRVRLGYLASALSRERRSPPPVDPGSGIATWERGFESLRGRCLHQRRQNRYTRSCDIWAADSSAGLPKFANGSLRRAVCLRGVADGLVVGRSSPMRPTRIELATFGLKDRRSLVPVKGPLTTELRAPCCITLSA